VGERREGREWERIGGEDMKNYYLVIVCPFSNR
jgi:hypothetical protein